MHRCDDILSIDLEPEYIIVHDIRKHDLISSLPLSSNTLPSPNCCGLHNPTVYPHWKQCIQSTHKKGPTKPYLLGIFYI